MRIRKKKWAQPELEKCSYYVGTPQEFKNQWRDFFKNELPIYLDLGCGKCVFLAEAAMKNPQINYIGIDISVDILGVGRRNIEKAFESRPVKNIALLLQNIERLSEIFGQNEGIERIYINFCNPWPRAGAHKRRLTHTEMLKMYSGILKPGGEIHFKTDNDDLYLASLRYFKEAGYEILFSTQDLHACREEENYISEHEKMFTAQGIKTKAIHARRE